MNKKQVRANFRNAVFKRDNYSCVVCGKSATQDTAEELLDAHHITNRNEIANGGYVVENGISLCKGIDGTSCHEKAEAQQEGFSPEELYKLVGSTKEKAEAASRKLG